MSDFLIENGVLKEYTGDERMVTIPEGVIKIDNAADAKPLAKALIDGGLPCAEVTFRTACAKEAIEYASKKGAAYE